jgi:3-(3-hydroxy-phenyl)propionate hydroxylase
VTATVETGTETPAVIVVGAGPSGLVAANVLGRAGIATLLLERDADLANIPKALMVDDEFARLLESLDLGDALRGHGVGPISYEWQSPLGFKIAYNVGRYTLHNQPNRTAIFQPVFERILFEGAKQYGSVTVRFGEEVIAVDQMAEDVAIRVRRTSGEERTYRARFAIAADGASSAVRKLLGIAFEQVAKMDERSVVVDVANDPDTSTTAIGRATWKRYSSSLPAPGGRRYEFKLLPGEDAEAALSDASLARLFAPLRDFRDVQVIRKAVYAYRSCIAKDFRRGGVFLVGDAAHIMPVTGSQGMNSGARDANNIAWKLAAVVRGIAGPAVLDSYHQERYGHVRDTIRVVTAQTKLRAIRSAPVMFVRDLAVGLSMLVPPLRRAVAEMRYLPKPFFRNGLVIDPPPDERHGIAGRVIPNPSVRVDGVEQKLDAALGRNWALVGIETGTDRPAGLDHPLWARLEAIPIALDAGDVIDEARFADLRALHRGQWLVVRPDRIVAAAVSAEQLAATADRLAVRLGVPAAARAVPA